MKRRRAKNLKIFDVISTDYGFKQVVGKKKGVDGLLSAPQLMEIYFRDSRITLHEDTVVDVLTKPERAEFERMRKTQNEK